MVVLGIACPLDISQVILIRVTFLFGVGRVPAAAGELLPPGFFGRLRVVIDGQLETYVWYREGVFQEFFDTCQVHMFQLLRQLGVQSLFAENDWQTFGEVILVEFIHRHIVALSVNFSDGEVFPAN